MSDIAGLESGFRWFKVAEKGALPDNNRMHVRVEERYITIFRHKGVLSAIDAICHHAGGPLTLGPLQEIEDLGITVVLCPWHKFMVSIDNGLKAYQGVEFVGGKPRNAGWKIGKVVQRPHKVVELESGLYLVSLLYDVHAKCSTVIIFISLNTQAPVISEEVCSSDQDSCSYHCAQDYTIYAEVTEAVPISS